MRTSITLDRMIFHAYHGVLPQERIVGNKFEVSVTVYYPLDPAMSSDNLSDTLDYSALYGIVAEEMGKPSKLLEHVVGRIIIHIRQQYPQITGGSVTLAKLTPPITGEMASVSITAEF